MLIKDNIGTADRMMTTAGSLALEGANPAKDSFVARRLREAGAVILGKTNLSEWANFRSTRSTSGWSGRGGRTRNPYALDRNTSGSSSGSGAAIAASYVTAALGSDTGGSIRQPASFCGVTGLKPTYGRVSRYGLVAYASSFDQIGPLTKDVTDSALLLAAIAGHDPVDSTSVDAPAPDYAAELRRSASGSSFWCGIMLAGMSAGRFVSGSRSTIVSGRKPGRACIFLCARCR